MCVSLTVILRLKTYTYGVYAKVMIIKHSLTYYFFTVGKGTNVTLDMRGSRSFRQWGSRSV